MALRLITQRLQRATEREKHQPQLNIQNGACTVKDDQTSAPQLSLAHLSFYCMDGSFQDSPGHSRSCKFSIIEAYRGDAVIHEYTAFRIVTAALKLN